MKVQSSIALETGKLGSCTSRAFTIFGGRAFYLASPATAQIRAGER
jgi:hypothetical protein